MRLITEQHTHQTTERRGQVQHDTHGVVRKHGTFCGTHPQKHPKTSFVSHTSPVCDLSLSFTSKQRKQACYLCGIPEATQPSVTLLIALGILNTRSISDLLKQKKKKKKESQRLKPFLAQLHKPTYFSLLFQTNPSVLLYICFGHGAAGCAIEMTRLITQLRKCTEKWKHFSSFFGGQLVALTPKSHRSYASEINQHTDAGLVPLGLLRLRLCQVKLKLKQWFFKQWTVLIIWHRWERDSVGVDVVVGEVWVTSIQISKWTYNLHADILTIDQ